MEDDRHNIYKLSKMIKRRVNTLYNALRSIYDDSIFVGEISQLWPELPVLANLRCGLWYSPKFDSTCYFKSTDGHTNNLSFNTSRLNLHVALLAAHKGGCLIVDSTRKGKRFPDSMAKTIPIWTCILNRAIHNYRARLESHDSLVNELKNPSELSVSRPCLSDWDCSLHLPLWVSDTERAMIEKRLEIWTHELELSGADIGSISSSLRKPLRPLWISQRTVIWLNEIPEHDSWNFNPIILVSASCSSDSFRQQTTSEFSWSYIAGAGDDEECWSRGLSPYLFWQHANEIITSGPELCNQTIANIIEKDRVRRLRKGETAPQVSAKTPKCLSSTDSVLVEDPLCDNGVEIEAESRSIGDTIIFLGSTNLAIGKSQLGALSAKGDTCATVGFEIVHGGWSGSCRATAYFLVPAVLTVPEVPRSYCILNCDIDSLHVSMEDAETYLHLPFTDSKLDRSSLLENLPFALEFAKKNMRKSKMLFICCSNGEDISICVCLAILVSFYDEAGIFDDGKSLSEMQITKFELRKRLVFLCNYAVNARPSRGNLKQVFAFLSNLT